MNRGNVTPQPQFAVDFGFTNILLPALGGSDKTTPGALVGCCGAPRTAIVAIPYQAMPWLAAVGA